MKARDRQTTMPEENQATQQMTDIRGVATMLHCSVETVRRLHDSGRMPSAVRFGRILRWNIGSIEAWIEDGCPAIRRPRRKR